MLILFGAVMKADNELKKSELEFIKKFFIQHFNINYAQDRMQLFKEILKQEYPLDNVCFQIKTNMDYASRLQMIHILFGLSQADGHVHPLEIKVIHTISNYLGITVQEFKSIRAMFFQETTSHYKILDIDSNAIE